MKHLPHIHPDDYTPETLGTALWLDEREREQLEIAVTNGISRAFGGES